LHLSTNFPDIFLIKCQENLLKDANFLERL